MRETRRRWERPSRSFRPRADARRTGQPDLPVRRRRCLEHEDLGRPARAVLVLRGTAQENRPPWCWPSIRHGDRVRRQAPPGSLPVRGRRQVDVPRVRRYLAVAVSRGRQVLRTVLGPDDPVSGEVAAGRPAAGRGRRPTAAGISAGSRSSFASGSPTPGSRPRRVTSRSRSPQPARARASSRSSWCRAPRTFSRGRCRKPPRETTRSGCCRPRCSKVRSRRPLSGSMHPSMSLNASK